MFAETVFADANVLYSKTTRDWLFHLRGSSSRGMFVVASTVDVVAEVMYNLRRDNPTWSGRATKSIHDGLTSTLDMIDDFDGEIEYDGTDLNDRHVHAAAVASHASFLITSDDRLSRIASDSKPYEAMTPDDFFVLIDDSSGPVVELATSAQIAYWRHRGEKPNLVTRLQAAQCPKFAERVDAHIKVLAGTLSRSARRSLGR